MDIKSACVIVFLVGFVGSIWGLTHPPGPTRFRKLKKVLYPCFPLIAMAGYFGLNNF